MTLDERTPPRALPATADRLAVAGGRPVVPEGYLMHARWPRVEEGDVRAVTRVLRTGRLTEMAARDAVHDYEAEFAAAFGARFSLLTNSGTAALHCALAGLGVEPGDEVVVPALGYIACAAAVVHQHAIPVFADVDPATYVVTPATVEAAITERTRVVMVVHLHGLPADLDGIRAVAARHGVAVLEDFSQAVGATYGGRPVGGLADAGAASLMAGKNLPSAGEAGVLVTDRREVRNGAATLKCFAERIEPDGLYAALDETAGWNYRPALVALAFASRQLFRLGEHTRLRQRLAAELDEQVDATPGCTAPVVPAGSGHAYHMYRFRFDPVAAGLDVTADQAREALRQAFWAEGLPLVEFQNAPLPGHALLQRRLGGCPWTCHGRDDLRYRIEDYPGALDAIRGSLVVGFPARSPLTSPEVVAAYARCFGKVAANLREFERFAAGLPSRPPWASPPRIF